jgi:hypothetical protein
MHRIRSLSLTWTSLTLGHTCITLGDHPMAGHITEPLLQEQAELIVEDTVAGDPSLQQRMLADVAGMSDQTKETILVGMLKMHKEIQDDCGDLDVSLNSIAEIAENTEAWYVILDGNSTPELRAVRYHYRANWETYHGVEVIVINGDRVFFVGNCGYVSSINRLLKGEEDEFNYL